MLIDQKRERRNEAKRHRLQGEAIGEKRGEKRGEKIGEINAKREVVRRLIKQGGEDDREIAYLAGVDEGFVRQQRLRSRTN